VNEKVNSTVKPMRLLQAVFFFSGFSSLIYQVGWQRLLSLHYGVGAISIALIVSIYMFGLGVGALLGGLLTERTGKRILLYFVVELLIGCFGLLSIPLLEFLGSHTAGSSFILSFLYMSLFLCIPTLLMGVTLPLLTKIFNAQILDFVRTVSLLYFINTIGAATGSLFASYVLISLFGLDIAIYFAAAVNFVLAALIFLSRSACAGQTQQRPHRLQDVQADLLGKSAYCFVFITGFLAIGYEIAWFRIVEVLVKASAYAFSTVLSIYLFGIAFGSLAMGRYLQKRPHAERKDLLFVLQFLIGISVMTIFISYRNLTWYTAFGNFTLASFLCDVHPPLVDVPFPIVVGRWYCMADIVIWPVVFVLLPTMLMGACFPLISALALADADKEAATVGTVFFFNIAGNVLGGIVTGFALLPLLRTEVTLLAFSSVGLLFGLFVSKFAGRNLRAAEKVAFVVILLIADLTAFPKKGELYKTIHTFPWENPSVYLEEGADGVVVTGVSGEEVSNYINGLGHGRRPQPLFTYEAVEAMSFAQSVDNVLIIGFGTGTISEAVLKSDDVRKVTVVELSKTLMKNLNKIPIFNLILGDSRLNLVIDDGRRFLLRTNEKFDLILTDPLRATTAYSNNVYSQQFYRLAGEHLNPGGVLMVGIYEHDKAINNVMRKTLASAFEHVRAYTFFALASNQPLERNAERRQRLVNAFDADMRKSLLSDRLLDFAAAEIRPEQTMKPKEIYLGDRQYIEEAASRYPINEDYKPVCEYYIGLKIRQGLTGGE